MQTFFGIVFVFNLNNLVHFSSTFSCNPMDAPSFQCDFLASLFVKGQKLGQKTAQTF